MTMYEQIYLLEIIIRYIYVVIGSIHGNGDGYKEREKKEQLSGASKKLHRKTREYLARI